MTFGKVNSILVGESLEGFHAVSAFSVASRIVGGMVIQMEITTLDFYVGEVTTVEAYSFLDAAKEATIQLAR